MKKSSGKLKFFDRERPCIREKGLSGITGIPDYGRLYYLKLKGIIIKVTVFLFVLTCILNKNFVCFAQKTPQTKKTEISAGYGMMIYETTYGFRNSSGVEAAIKRSFRENLALEAGFRLGTDPVRPEGFIRLMATHQSGRWHPSIGIETGITDRAYFKGSDKLLEEPRDAMSKDTGHFYIGTQAELLCFKIKDKWNVSFLELNLGTHYKDFGRTLRVQVNIISFGVDF